MPEDIHGNIEGVRKSTLAELQTFIRFPAVRTGRIPARPSLLEPAGAGIPAAYEPGNARSISPATARCIDIAVGDTASVRPAAISACAAARGRLSCVPLRAYPSAAAPPSCRMWICTALRIPAAWTPCARVGVSAEGALTGVQAAFLHERVNGEPQPVCTPILVPAPPAAKRSGCDEIDLSDERVMQGDGTRPQTDAPERALLDRHRIASESLDELAGLAETAGAVVVGRVLHKRKTRPDTGYLHRQRQGRRAGAGLRRLWKPTWHHRGRRANRRTAA